jgi:predicted permease
MNNLALIILCLIVGLALQRVKRMPADASVSLNLYVIYVALPALVLAEIPRLHMNSEALLPIFFAWGLMAFSAAITWFIARLAGWSRSITGVLMLTVTLGNTGFVGIPLIEAHLGSQAIPYAILYDQLGTFLALNTIGVMMAVNYSSGNVSLAKLAKSIFTFPPFIILMLAFPLSLWTYPEWLETSLDRVAASLVPVVMVAVGLQWRMRLDREYLSPMLIGLVLMLVVTPAVAFLVIKAMGLNGLVANVIVLEAAMPAMISAAVLAISHNLAPRLASALTGYSLLASLLTVWVWRLLITG